MAKRLTVFYSWQSDTPSNLNRNFIEKAIQEALKRLHSDATLENALRDAIVELDKDTKGVAGSPPIAETILGKIEECAVFVADLTYVGETLKQLTDPTDKSRLFPNPNVLIEHGFALKCHGHGALVGIMNTAYGKPNADSLPFDLRHLRWPITYHLASPSDPDKESQFEKLVDTLVEAIGLILSNHSSLPVIVEKFVPQKATKTMAVFFESSEELLADRSGEFVVPEGGKAWLRLYPTFAVPPINSELEARQLAINGNLQPFGRVRSCGFDRNVFGALVFESPEDKKLFHFTQLFLSREIWGVDAKSVNADCILYRFENQPGAYIANGYVENCFVNALRNYLAFARDHLKLPIPLRVEAGLVGIKGYPITVSSFNIAGKSLRDSISWQAEVSSYDKPAWEILEPFFDRVWDNCGIQRTSQHHTAYVKQFTRQ
jgi:hypothetical protein